MYRSLLVVCCLYLALTEEVRMTLVLRDCQKARLLARSSASVLINAKCRYLKLMSQISKMSEILLNQLAILSLFLMVSELQVMLKVHSQAFPKLVKS